MALCLVAFVTGLAAQVGFASSLPGHFGAAVWPPSCLCSSACGLKHPCATRAAKACGRQQLQVPTDHPH